MITTSPWWRHDIETLTTLLGLHDGNALATSGFPLQRANDAELWWYLCCQLNTLLNMELSCQWFEMPLGSHENAAMLCFVVLLLCCLPILNSPRWQWLAQIITSFLGTPHCKLLNEVPLMTNRYWFRLECPEAEEPMSLDQKDDDPDY